MSEQRDGYSIGFKELYELTQQIDTKLDAVTLTQVSHEGRITALEKKNDRSWQMVAVWVASGTALIGSIVGPLIGA